MKKVTNCVQGVISPLLSNIILDKLDKELERRGHRFVRYADDCSIYVKSKRSGDRVMESIRAYIEKELKLKVNVEKSVVTRPWQTRLLGFTFIIRRAPRVLLYIGKALASTRIRSVRSLAAGNPLRWKIV